MSTFFGGKGIASLKGKFNFSSLIDFFKGLSIRNIFRVSLTRRAIQYNKSSMDKSKENKVESSSKTNVIIKENNNNDDTINDISEETPLEGNRYAYLTQGKTIGSFYNRKNHKRLPGQIALSFSGAGFLGVYHYGVVHCLQAYAPNLMSRVIRYAGTSVGSIIASLFALSPDLFNQSMVQIMEMADETNSLAFGAITNGFSIHEKLVEAVNRIIPEDVSCLKNKLYISMTNAKTNQNVLYNYFPTKAQLTAAICASCYIPGWSAHYNAPHPVVDGITYIDGGLSNNLPVFDDIETITISPFSGSADISPSDNSLFSSYLPMQITFGKQVYSASFANMQRLGYALFPPKGETLKMYYDLGFKDAFVYLYESGRLERPRGTAI
uniref:PNPLA domain-containing protein n=1 Tax=Parastrongyloides trichosuri TaxID=131310 RepID=A0A0N4ZW01_PARTI